MFWKFGVDSVMLTITLFYSSWKHGVPCASKRWYNHGSLCIKH